MNYTNLMNSLISQVSMGYIGNSEIVKDAILAFSSGLHILIDDISGVGKTTLSKSISKAAGLECGRIQFTPDLLPGDITGMSIWDNNKREFILKKGPIFNEFILADEINRSSARTQSALLEAMEEKTVSIDGTKFSLPDFFSVIATKNPSHYIGTYDLPESQLDRFGIVLKPGYPTPESEVKILNNFKNTDPLNSINAVTNSEELNNLVKHIQNIKICNSVLNYTVELGNLTRTKTEFNSGLSTRALKHLILFAQAKAVYENRDYLIPEDIIYSFYRVSPHKIELSQDSIINNIKISSVLRSIIDSVKIPVGIK